MKKFFLFLTVCVFACMAWSCSDDDDKDTPISVNDLPVAAKNFISQFYSSDQVVIVTKEVDKANSSYEVKFKSGQEVEFDAAGAWTDVDAPTGKTIPTGIVPEIDQYVEQNFQSVGINEISRYSRDYEVDLLNGRELLFTLDFVFVGYGD